MLLIQDYVRYRARQAFISELDSAHPLSPSLMPAVIVISLKSLRNYRPFQDYVPISVSLLISTTLFIHANNCTSPMLTRNGGGTHDATTSDTPKNTIIVTVWISAAKNRKHDDDDTKKHFKYCGTVERYMPQLLSSTPGDRGWLWFGCSHSRWGYA